MGDESAGQLPRTDSASLSVNSSMQDAERTAKILAGEIYELRKIVVANLCVRSRLCTYKSVRPEEHAPLCAAGLEIKRASREASKGLKL
jgi:hypothetical protein